MLFDGPVDTAVSDEVGAEMLATLREGLANVAHHARASRVEVEVLVNNSEVLLQVSDDGVGPPGPDVTRGHGLANMEARAERLGGKFELRAGDPTGSVIEWRVPLVV